MFAYCAMNLTKFVAKSVAKSGQIHDQIHNQIHFSEGTGYTGCPVNWYSLSISIPDFSDCPIKKI